MTIGALTPRPCCSDAAVYASSLGSTFEYTWFFRGEDAWPKAVDLLEAQGFAEAGTQEGTRKKFIREDSRTWYAATIANTSIYQDQRASDCEPADLRVGDTIVLVSTSMEED